jgi:hypothetical protein
MPPRADPGRRLLAESVRDPSSPRSMTTSARRSSRWRSSGGSGCPRWRGWHQRTQIKRVTGTATRRHAASSPTMQALWSGTTQRGLPLSRLSRSDARASRWRNSRSKRDLGMDRVGICCAAGPRHVRAIASYIAALPTGPDAEIRPSGTVCHPANLVPQPRPWLGKPCRRLPVPVGRAGAG